MKNTLKLKKGTEVYIVINFDDVIKGIVHHPYKNGKGATIKICGRMTTYSNYVQAKDIFLTKEQAFNEIKKRLQKSINDLIKLTTQTIKSQIECANESLEYIDVEDFFYEDYTVQGIAYGLSICKTITI